MARRSGGAARVDRHASALLAPSGRLLFAAGERCFGCGTEISCLLGANEHAEVRNRTRDSRRGKHVAAGFACRITEIVQRSTESWPADSVGAELRNGR